MLKERMEFAPSSDIRCGNEHRNVRNKNKYKRTCEIDEFNLMQTLQTQSETDGTAGASYLKPISITDTHIRFERKKPLWEVFEDKVWEMFYHLNTPVMPIGKTVARYGDESTKQIDGLFADDEFVYIVECKWRRREGNVNQHPGEIKKELSEWRGIWSRLTENLKDHPELQGKKFVFILATTGVKWTKPLLEEGKDFASFIDQHSVDEIIKLTKLIGHSARTNLLQKLFFGQELPSTPELFPCIRSQVSDISTYCFFAKPSQLVDHCYVPRRSPGNKFGLGSAYQRMLNPRKVNQIRDYLDNTSSFFPNSIIVSADQCHFEPTDSEGRTGFLSLPHRYGAVMIIDGQHRLFGSIKQRGEKPLPFCLVEGLSGFQQSQLFTQINQNQTTVPADLLWDLYGEGVNLDAVDDSDTGEVKMALNFIISNIWKNLNERKSHPLCGRIIIPSQTVKDNEYCHLSFGQMCNYLAKNKTLWSKGYLLGSGDWKSSMSYAQHRVDHYFRYLHANLEDEWNKTKADNWLLSNYSFEALIALFTHACLFFAGVPTYHDKWKKSDNKEVNNAREMLKEFCEILSRALVDEKHGFYNQNSGRDITKQGNAAQRNDYMKAVVKFIRNDNPAYKEHFAPKLEIDDDKEGDYPSAEVKRRVQELELNYCSLIHEILLEEHGNNWYNRVPNDVQEYIDRQIVYKKMQGRKFKRNADLEWLQQTSSNHLLKIVQHKSMINPWKARIGIKPSMFAHHWEYGFEILRNMGAHGDPYPSTSTKNMVLGAIKLLEDWLDEALEEDLGSEEELTVEM